jgi:hypothetical protein
MRETSIFTVMKKIIFGFIIVFAVKGFAQVNLVPNPSFEIHDTCPNYFNQVKYALPWFTPTVSGTPDYFDTCSNIISGGQVGIPQNLYGYQYAEDGYGYVGLDAYDTIGRGLNREYIAVKLIAPLVINTKYFVSFYVSLADSCFNAIDQIGCLFSTDTIKGQDSLPFNLMPQVVNPNFSYLNDKINWMKIKGSFVADSVYKFITISNFKSENQTHDVYAPGGAHSGFPLSWHLAIYYIDNVCVSTDSVLAYSNSIQQYNKSNNINIYPNPATTSIQVSLANNISTTLVLTDMLGNAIYHSTFTTQHNIISVADLAEGVYNISISHKEGLVNKKVVIVR